MANFEWSPDKDRSNQEKHGVSFLEAATVFADPLARTVPDPRAYEGEYRWGTTGYTSKRRLVVVWHTDRGERIRIIGARDATPRERRDYESEI
jgi:uncharacterized DUF497 family protein